MIDMKFQKLTPKQDVELGDYEKAFDFIFKERDITNIAISGAYSSGKSSLIESYELKHDKYKFMHISLAHFKQSDEQSNIHSDIKGTIEGKVLNQLLQQIPSEKIPLTNFRIKKKVKRSVGLKITVFLGLFLSLAILCLKFWDLNTFVSRMDTSRFKGFMQCILMPELRFIYGIGALGILMFGVYGCISVQQSRNIFKRLSFQGNEIEIFEESNESYFDKYLNDVLYLFENSGVDAIVFEDIDRFDSVRIFERLREINTLTNIRLKSDGKSIKFFYCLRDDIFQTKDRTKFFDFIIPVVPVLDSSNSYNKIKEYLESAGIYQAFNDHFLRGVSLYIDDLRLLKNIFNEFLLYRSKLSNIELDVNKLFAILTYKNLFPKDFAELQLNRGFVYNLFSSREDFIEERVLNLIKKRDALQKKIVQGEQDNLQSEYELILVQNATKYNWNSYFPDNTAFDKWNNGISERLKRFQNPEHRLEKLKDELTKLDSQIENIKSLSLSELLDREHIDEAFKITYTDENGETSSFAEIKGNSYFGLLKYLLSRGYIDESYLDYMSYFYDNSLTINDKNFLRSITDRVGKEADYHIDNCQLVLESLDEYDFSEPETRNYDLIAYILSDSIIQNVHNKSIINFFECLKYGDIENSFEFINGYIKKGKQLPEFIKALVHNYPEVLSDSIEYEQMNSEQLRSFVLLFLSYCSDEDLRKSCNDIVLEYISNNSRITELEAGMSDAMKKSIVHALKLVGVAFKMLSSSSDSILLQGIYENNLYVLNENNIKLLLNEYFGKGNADTILGSFCDFIINHANAPIAQYILLNKRKFSGIYLEFWKSSIFDRSESIVKLLNDSEISIETKKQYILKLESKIESLEEVTVTNIWDLILREEALTYSTENVLTYFKKYGLSNELISYLNKNPKELHYKEYPEQACINSFGAEVLTCNDLNINTYKQIVSELVSSINSFDVIGLSTEKVDALIAMGTIEMTYQNLNFVRSSYVDNIMNFIYCNLEEYIALIDRYGYEINEIQEVLSNAEIPLEIKKKLLASCNAPMSILRRSYADELKILILDQYLKTEEISEYLREYSSFSIDIQKALIKVFANNLAEIENYKGEVPESLILDIIESTELTIEVKEGFFSIFVDILSDNQLEDFLVSINQKKIVGNLFRNDNFHVEANDKNNRIINELYEARRISDPEKMSETLYKKLRLIRKRNHEESVVD